MKSMDTGYPLLHMVKIIESGLKKNRFLCMSTETVCLHSRQ